MTSISRRIRKMFVILRATLAQDDRFGSWSFCLTFQSSQDFPDAAGIGGRFLNRPYEIFGFSTPAICEAILNFPYLYLRFSERVV